MITALKQLAGLEDWLDMVSAESAVLVAPPPVSAAQSGLAGGLPGALFHDQGCPGLMETSRIQVGVGSTLLDLPWQCFLVGNHRFSSLWL